MLQNIFSKSIALGICLFLGVALLQFLDLRYPPNLQRFVERSPVMLDEKQELLAALLSPDEKWRLLTSSEEVHPEYLHFLIAFEDKRFFSHWGVDFFALGRACFQALQKGKIVSGASTLTMQVVRLLDPRPRTFWNKGIEMLKAFQLESHFTKEEILTFYLTLAPFGGNIEGVRAASWMYFQRHPRFLSIEQALLLVAIPQSPSRLRPDRHPKQAHQACLKLLSCLEKQQLFAPKEAAFLASKILSLNPDRTPLPLHAPHLLYGFKRKFPQETVFETTLHLSLQKNLEKQLEQQLTSLEPEANIAVMMVENKTGAVLAYAGSADFHQDRRYGKINFVKAVRSPGSALKPAIYALAFQDKLIHPETLIEDRSFVTSGYHPKNFSNTYHGQMTVREALQQSLNIPAVMVLKRLGPYYFTQHLSQGGIPLLFYKKEQAISLPIALGGVGCTLETLMKLYTSFAREGRSITPRILKRDPLQENALFSSAAAWYITHILQESPAPEHVVDWRLVHQQAIAYKTGTSYGYRDSWALGYTDQHTIGVWIGRADHLPCAGLTGRKGALPFLFQLFAFFPSQPALVTTPPPEEVLIAKNQDLPPHLQTFSTQKTLVHLSSFQITFPASGSRIQVFSKEKNQSFPLTILTEGGKGPFYWFINSKPHPPLLGNTLKWLPSHKGFTTITAVDALGHHSSIDLEIF